MLRWSVLSVVLSFVGSAAAQDDAPTDMPAQVFEGTLAFGEVKELFQTGGAAPRTAMADLVITGTAAVQPRQVVLRYRNVNEDGDGALCYVYGTDDGSTASKSCLGLRVPANAKVVVECSGQAIESPGVATGCGYKLTVQ